MGDQHTPGPWRLGNAGSVVADASHNGDRMTADSLAFYGGYLVAESIASRADADLIAAAPDLLQALDGLVSAVGGLTTGLCLADLAAVDRALDAARAAVAKARGGGA